MASGSPFDPCRQWLGISALELNDPRRLLGLEPTDNDAIRILQAAETRLARLNAVDAGSFEVARRALVARVEEARDMLLATAAHSAPPPVAGGGYAMPPPPLQQASAHEQDIPPESMTVDTGWQQQQPSYQQPYQPLPAHPQQGFPSTAGYPTGGGYVGGPIYQSAGQPTTYRPGEPLYRPRSNNMPLVLLIGALVATVGLIGLVANPFEKSDRPKKTTTASRNTDSSKNTDSSRNTDTKASDRPGREVAEKETRPAKPAAPENEAPPQPEPPKPEPPKPEPSKPEPSKPEPSKPEPSKPEPSKPEPPKPEPPKPKPDDGPDPLARIDEAVKRSRASLASRDFDAAERELKAVSELAPDRREVDRIAAWLQLVTYARGFYDYRNQALAAAKPGNEYDVGTRKIAVVEVTEESFSAKVAGQVKTWSRDSIPGAVLQAIVTSWFDEKAANHLYLGAYHFTKPEPDVAEAEESWNRAMAGGANASPLLSLLSDPVVVDDGDPTPSK